jgi:diguanylate cyclase (GGDEF)-like protein
MLAAPIAAQEAAPALQALAAGVELAAAPPEAILRGDLDARFAQFRYRDLRRAGGPFWLRLNSPRGFTPHGVPVLVVAKGRHLGVEAHHFRAGVSQPLRRATELQGFRGVHEVVFAIPDALRADDAIYLRAAAVGSGAESLEFELDTLHGVLARGAEQSRMIAGAFGALLAVTASAVLIFFVLRDRTFILYAALFFLQALYVAYSSGEGFAWPLLWRALPLGAHAWNVPAALSGAAACLFVREITDLRRYLPRLYPAFGWLALAFVVLALANLGELIGLGGLVATIGNLVFIGSAAFTLGVAFLAWRRGSRAAGWFLVAWGLLETFTIATAVSFLFGESARLLLYYGLPLSMVAAAVLVALGVADRLREQRVALSEAQRRAQLDPLTGVLNRSSLVERLEAACLRAQARGLPIALLFIDLDHFKSINDTHGHLAGDACLRAVVGPIQSELRQSDVIGRYGGEEFVVIMPDTDETTAVAVAERIRHAVGASRIDIGEQQIGMTVSIGVASLHRDAPDLASLLRRADQAMYAAKRGGRNRVVAATRVGERA